MGGVYRVEENRAVPHSYACYYGSGNPPSQGRSQWWKIRRRIPLWTGWEIRHNHSRKLQSSLQTCASCPLKILNFIVDPIPASYRTKIPSTDYRKKQTSLPKRHHREEGKPIERESISYLAWHSYPRRHVYVYRNGCGSYPLVLCRKPFIHLNIWKLYAQRLRSNVRTSKHFCLSYRIVPSSPVLKTMPLPCHSWIRPIFAAVQSHVYFIQFPLYWKRLTLSTGIWSITYFNVLYSLSLNVKQTKNPASKTKTIS